jgi:hypothetical protein
MSVTVREVPYDQFIKSIDKTDIRVENDRIVFRDSDGNVDGEINLDTGRCYWKEEK